MVHKKPLDLGESRSFYFAQMEKKLGDKDEQGCFAKMPFNTLHPVFITSIIPSKRDTRTFSGRGKQPTKIVLVRAVLVVEGLRTSISSWKKRNPPKRVVLWWRGGFLMTTSETVCRVKKKACVFCLPPFWRIAWAGQGCEEKRRKEKRKPPQQVEI